MMRSSGRVHGDRQGSSNGRSLTASFLRGEALVHQAGQHVAVLDVEVVVRAEDVGRHDRGELAAVLRVVRAVDHVDHPLGVPAGGGQCGRAEQRLGRGRPSSGPRTPWVCYRGKSTRGGTQGGSRRRGRRRLERRGRTRIPRWTCGGVRCGSWSRRSGKGSCRGRCRSRGTRRPADHDGT